MPDVLEREASTEEADLSDSSPDETPTDGKPEEEAPEEGTEKTSEEEKSEEGREGKASEKDAAETTQEEKPRRQPPVPYERFSKVVAAKNEALDQLEDTRARLAELEKYAEQVKPAVALFESIQKARQFDPRIRELLHDHWLFTGRQPSTEDIDDVRAYADFLAERRLAEASQNQPKETEPQGLDEREQKIYDVWLSEEEKLKRDKELGFIATDDRLSETYNEILERVRKGEDVSKLSFEKVFRELFFDDIVEAERERGRKEAMARKARQKPASMSPGRAATSKPADLSKLPLHEHIHRFVRGETSE